MFFRGHPKMKKIDIMHAADLKNLSSDGLAAQVNRNKAFDESLSKAVEYVFNYWDVKSLSFQFMKIVNVV